MMGELVVGRPVMRQSFTVSAPLVLSSALGLTFRAVAENGKDLQNGFDPALIEIRKSLSDELQQDLDLLLGFSGPYLYYIDELVFAFDVLGADRFDATYDEFFAHLQSLAPIAYQEMAVNSVRRVYRDREVFETPPDSSDQLQWQLFLRPGITQASVAEAAQVILDPEILKKRTLRLIHGFWRGHYQQVYDSNLQDLQRSVRIVQDIVHPVVQIAFSELTGQILPEEVSRRLGTVERVIYCPSVHLGSFVQYIFYEPELILYFNPSNVLSSRTPHQTRPRGESEDLSTEDALAGIKAIADPTRLKIIEMLRYREHYAQEIVGQLGISQSAVSRHLGTLESSGVVSVRPSHGMKYYAVDGDFLRSLSQYVDHLAGQID